MVLVLGLADRVDDFSQIPDVLGRWEVLAVAFVIYAMEFVADKIPYIDSTWDAISTAIRPTVGRPASCWSASTAFRTSTLAADLAGPTAASTPATAASTT